MFNGDGTVSYHCFNCGYTASFIPGRNLSYKMRKLLGWFGMPNSEITKIALEALRIKEETVVDGNALHIQMPVFEKKELPVGAKPIMEWHDWKALEPSGLDPEFIRAVEYIVNDRGLDLEDYDFMWTCEGSYKTRLIVPFYYQGDIVGYTARKLGDGSPKYITDSQPGYVFNLDGQGWDRKFVIVCEGPFDAISIGGVAVLRNEVNDQQSMLINSLQREVIVVPDKDQSGQQLADDAVKYGWSVSFPIWPDSDIKDVADAVKRYGKIYTMQKIVHSKVTGLKIQLLAKTYFAE
jgi:5S rRNA maturation endonuclease (ribonuclease M5)